MGTSFVSSCACSAFVAVATTTLRPDSSAGIEVGEALPGARARFGKQVLARLEGVGHSPGELGLLRSRLVAGQNPSDRAPDAEDVFHARQRMTRGGGRREKLAPSALFRPGKPLTEAACAP